MAFKRPKGPYRALWRGLGHADESKPGLGQPAPDCAYGLPKRSDLGPIAPWRTRKGPGGAKGITGHDARRASPRGVRRAEPPNDSVGQEQGF